MEQRDCYLERGVHEGVEVRRQEIDGESEERPETHHAIAVEDDVAVDEDIVSMVHSTYAPLVVLS